jgi:DNA (cytosine-5)-methyltransferase 1
MWNGVSTTDSITPGDPTSSIIRAMAKKNTSKTKIVGVDLFCGVGGLTHGLRKAGIRINAGYDIDPACAWPFEANNGRAKFRKEDVTELTGAQIKAELNISDGEISLLAGCAPCQPFSSYSLNKTDKGDKRWSMLEHFGRLVQETKPALVTMENVPQVRKHPVFDRFVQILRDSKYHVSVNVVHCEQYGIPQARTRLVLLASRLGPISLRPHDLKQDAIRTVRETIGDMLPLDAGYVSEEDPIHRSSELNAINLQRIRASVPGGSWKDWAPGLQAACHQEESGKTFPSVYGRMEWDKPSPTITTQFFGFGNGRFGHPEQDRAISLREGALLQTFPADYKFVKAGEPVAMKTVGRLIGNAVPVRLGEIIGQSLLRHIAAIRPQS